MKIGIDIDGTICESIKMQYAFTSDYIKKNNLPYDFNPQSNSVYIEDAYKLSKEDTGLILSAFLKFIENNPDSVPVFPFVAQVVDELKSLGHKVYVVTRRSTRFFSNPHSATETFLRLNNINVDGIFCAVENKGEFCMLNGIELLIDDQSDNCFSANSKGVKAILIDADYNADYSHPLCVRAKNWLEIKDIISDKNNANII